MFEKISALIEESRKKVATAVNVAELYLPDKNELQAKLKSWIEEYEAETL